MLAVSDEHVNRICLLTGKKKTFLCQVRECFYSSDRFVEFLRSREAKTS